MGIDRIEAAGDPTPEARPTIGYQRVMSRVLENEYGTCAGIACAQIEALAAAGYVIVSQEEAEASRRLRDELAAKCESFGLPATATVTGLMRHMENNAAAAFGGFELAIRLLKGQLAACREAQQDPTRREGE